MRTKDESEMTSILRILNTGIFQIFAVSIWIISTISWVVQFSHPLILPLIIPLVIAGYFLGNRISRTALTVKGIIVSSIMLYLLARLGSFLITSSALLSEILGTMGAYILSEAVFWSAILFATVFVCRILSMRNPALLSLEMILTSILLTSPFWAHRMGFINRPIPLIDRTWYYGIDPRAVFLAIGFGICFVLFFVISNRRESKKSVLDIFLFFILLLLLFFFIPLSKIQKFVAGTGGNDKGKSSTPSPTPSRSQKPSGGSSSPSHDKSSGKEDENSQTEMQNSASSGSDVPVAVVNLHDDYMPLDGYYYFRQTAFSQYNGIRLVKDETGAADLDILEDFPQGETKVALENIEPGESPPVKPDEKESSCYKYLETTVGMITSHTRPFGLVNLYLYKPMQNLDPDRFDRIYNVGSYVRIKPYEAVLGKPVGSKKWNEKLWAHYTEAPPDPRYIELANEIISKIDLKYRNDPIIQALAIKLWLDENCTYSLKCAHAESKDPTASFLFGDRTGYCVYTAHSACYLMRSLGIPSRVCGGYAVDERYRGGSSTIMILGKYSHLWPELYIEGLGWIIIDIAPKKSLEPPPEAPDQNLQSMMGDMVRKGSSPSKNTPPHPSLKIDFRPFLKAMLIFFLLALVVLYCIKIVRRALPYFSQVSDLPRTAFVSALDLLGEGGFIREYGESREAFADKIRAVSPSFRTLTDIHLSSFFGRSQRRDYDKNKILEIYGKTKKEASEKIPIFRKLIGFLNPLSWLLTK